MLFCNQKLLDPFVLLGEDLDVCYSLQSYFDLPKGTFKNIGPIIILFQQLLKDVDHFYGDIVGSDMTYDELKCLCKEECNEKYDCLIINV